MNRESVEKQNICNRRIMDNEEVNKFLHEKVMGECWHDTKFLPVEDRGLKGHRYVCLKCKHRFISNSKGGPDYCSSLDEVSKVEAKVIEKVGRINLRKCLMDVVAVDLAGQGPAGLIVEESTFATAEQRARACLTATQMI